LIPGVAFESRIYTHIGNPTDVINGRG